MQGLKDPSASVQAGLMPPLSNGLKSERRKTHLGAGWAAMHLTDQLMYKGRAKDSPGCGSLEDA